MPRPRSWSDDDLRAAVAKAASMAEVVRGLRLGHGGAAYITVRTRMEQLGLVLGGRHGGEPARTKVDRGWAEDRYEPVRTWTEVELRDAVAEARSLNDVFTRLGLVVGGSQWQVIRALILDRGWSTDHWIRPLGAVVQNRGQAERFRVALETQDISMLVRRLSSRAEVIRELGFEPDTTTYRLLRSHLASRGMGDEHFEPAHAAMRRAQRPVGGKPLDEILVRNSSYRSIARLKVRLVESGLLTPECAICGLTTWRGRPITLHLDHINGVRDDHRLENLRFLCPNCHSQTETYCGRNKGRYVSSE